ncbi:unnamed protein product [Caenorhabditis angaria]|uniref:Uncharacterized protein n=1 Tax=Caenorhabditis angaria TaxID=860376 RepID=A0A9P1N292_9PELO|nr:unnamed protein product [Caenorhabditis angaria]
MKVLLVILLAFFVLVDAKSIPREDDNNISKDCGAPFYMVEEIEYVPLFDKLTTTLQPIYTGEPFYEVNM